MKTALGFFFFIFIISCAENTTKMNPSKPVRFEIINYYQYPMEDSQKPFKYRLSYYFDDGKPHRWVELDSLRQVETEYIYQYNKTGLHTGAAYREDGAETYSIERVRFIDEFTQVTEWLDSLGNVYYTMTDYLNQNAQTIRAEFRGNEVHGYDSTFYTKEGFPKRIFFTNTNGKKFNDRSFIYDSINTYGDWTHRKKVITDTIRELQIRDLYYDRHFSTPDAIYYPHIVSTPERSQNVFSFTKDQSRLFLTETEDWAIQRGKLFEYRDGLWIVIDTPESLDSIYNAAISPSGDRIIITKKGGETESNWLIEKQDNGWSEPLNISENSTIVGGYFHWHNETDLLFYTADGKGDLAQGTLIDGQLVITDSLGQLNTEEATEFSPYMDAQKSFIIFTRYLEEETAQQGFFICYNAGSYETPIWEAPQKIEGLPYGWNACIINGERQFIFTDGNNIKSIPLKHLNIRLKNKTI